MQRGSGHRIRNLLGQLKELRTASFAIVFPFALVGTCSEAPSTVSTAARCGEAICRPKSLTARMSDFKPRCLGRFRGLRVPGHSKDPFADYRVDQSYGTAPCARCDFRRVGMKGARAHALQHIGLGLNAYLVAEPHRYSATLNESVTRLVVVNPTRRAQGFKVQDHELKIRAEALGPDGKWSMVMDTGWNRSTTQGIRTAILPPRSYWELPAPSFGPPGKDLIRYRLIRKGQEDLVSTPFYGSLGNGVCRAICGI